MQWDLLEARLCYIKLIIFSVTKVNNLVANFLLRLWLFSATEKSSVLAQTGFNSLTHQKQLSVRNCFKSRTRSNCFPNLSFAECPRGVKGADCQLESSQGSWENPLDKELPFRMVTHNMNVAVILDLMLKNRSDVEKSYCNCFRFSIFLRSWDRGLWGQNRLSG